MDVPIKSLNYRWQHDISGTILFNVKTNHSYRLNKTAFEVWNLCDGELDEAAIIDAMAARYEDMERADVEQDVIEILQFMKQKNMIVTNEPAV